MIYRNISHNNIGETTIDFRHHNWLGYYQVLLSIDTLISKTNERGKGGSILLLLPLLYHTCVHIAVFMQRLPVIGEPYWQHDKFLLWQESSLKKPARGRRLDGLARGMGDLESH